MATSIKDLTPAQCVLLAVHYASEGNIQALHSFTPHRLDAIHPEQVLRILLTYLPESLDPREYTGYVSEVGSRLYLDVDRQDIEVDVSPVNDVDDAQAQKKVKKLRLVELSPPECPPHAPNDLLTLFLAHRAYKIDQETGMLDQVTALVEPFLKRNEWTRVWYVSTVLPLLRLNFEYYPEDPCPMSLDEFSMTEGKKGIDLLLERAGKRGADEPSTPSSPGGAAKSNVGRDMKGLVGPWMYGHTERKRRRLDHARASRETSAGEESKGDQAGLTDGVRKIALDGVSEEDKTGHDWEYAYRWMVTQAEHNFPMITHLIEEWDGPSDVDFGGYEEGQLRPYLDDDVLRKLELQYAQASLASCYAAKDHGEENIKGAHGVLARLAELLDFIPPPDLVTSVESLPKIERQTASLDESQTLKDLAPDQLLRPEHPLSTPRMETYMLLQMHVYSAYQLLGLGYGTSLLELAKMQFYRTADDQMAVLQQILRGLSRLGKRDESDWTAYRAKLLWLWNWGIDADDLNAKTGPGVLGKIEKEDFESEMLKLFTDTACYDMITKLYLHDTNARMLPAETTEKIVLAKALEAYDGASNGNRMRGGVKKASDIINAFHAQFPASQRFRQVSSLIAATHALSFYSLTLQHGVPFQPVSIRVSKDSLGLIDKVLEQNKGSYTSLDDLIGIGQNLVSAGLPQDRVENGELDRADDSSDSGDVMKKRKDAERRVTFMAVEAALREDDFETAYSYIVNRLTPSGAEINSPNNTKHTRNTSTSSTRSALAPIEDDISWRAAFLAGRFRPATASPPTLRRLEQRTELLSLALLLAPTSALTDVLSAWRRCEEETTSLQLSQAQAEEEFDDRADKRQAPPSQLPGHFTVAGEQPQMLLNQKRREMGRMGTGGRGEEEAPVSMFDLTRSAARAFSKNAFPLGQGQGQGQAQQGQPPLQVGGRASEEMERSVDSLGEDGQRVRRRDMVANAVSGGLASGLGWVLGATPVDRQQ